MKLDELRKHAKEITLECEKRKYSIDDVEMLVAVLKSEVEDCKRKQMQNIFRAAP